MGNVFDLPEDDWLRLAHKKSIFHRKEIENSTLCGCFDCLQIFAQEKIVEWTDQSKPVSQQTALCPHCGIDCVIGDKSGFDITNDFLSKMKEHWC